MNAILSSSKIFIKETLTNKINILIFLITICIFVFSIHNQIENNKFVRNWTGKLVPISQDGLQKVIYEYTRALTFKLTIWLFINCLIFSIVPIIIDEKFINSRLKFFNILKNDLHILLIYIFSAIFIYNIFMLPYWLFMLYYDYSFYYRYTAGLVFFYNLFVVNMLLILLFFYLRAEYISKSIFKSVSTIPCLILINIYLSSSVAELNNIFSMSAEAIGKFFCIVDYLSINYFKNYFFMSPVYNFPYEGSYIVTDYTLVDSIKYFTLVFIPIVVIFGYLSLKSIDAHKRNIINSKPNMILH